MEILAVGPILISLDTGTTISLTRDELEELVDKAIDILEPGEADIEDILEGDEDEEEELTAADLIVAGVMALLQETEGGECNDCD